jgi:hypothetical protein
MIEVSISALFAIPLAVHLLALFLVWLDDAVRHARSPSLRTNSRLYRCAICEHVYVDTRDLPLARCPRCGCLNEAIKR